MIPDGYVATPAQRRVMEELTKPGDPWDTGPMNKILAIRLGCTERMVKEHLTDLMGATGCCTRVGLALWWIREGQYQGILDEAA